MATDFRHVVMTRFNLATPGRESSLRNRPGWLAERFDFFEKYCLPSLAAQDNQNFSWIIYFDEDTPDEFRQRIERCRRVREFTPYFTPLFPADGWPRSIRKTLVDPAPWLLTTRLDNDDALAIDFVARLQDAVSGAPRVPSSFNFLHGFVLGTDGLYAHDHPTNAFASWLEPWDPNMRTALSIIHMEIADHGPVIQISGPGAWLQVVHGGNVSNKIRGRLVRSEIAAGHFPPQILENVRQPSTLRVWWENGVMHPLRQARDFILVQGRRLIGRAS